MADLNAMLKRANADSQELAEMVQSVPIMERRASGLNKRGEDGIKRLVSDYPNGSVADVEKTLDQLSKLDEFVEKETIRLQTRVEQSKATMKRLTDAADADFVDATSYKMMLDYGEQYRISYVTLWVKAAVALAGLAVLRNPLHIGFAFATALVVMVLMFTWSFLQNMFTRQNPSGGGTEKGKTCADGTPSDATGSNCSTCPTNNNVPTNLYKACDDTPFGCCSDGLPGLDAELQSCATMPVCHSSPFGCCPDGVTERTDASGSTCDWTYYKGDCASTQFGCCPNGVIKQDELGSNCTPANMCGMSAFGCCPNGTNKVDASGSNCF
jgi:hypothetical protein